VGNEKGMEKLGMRNEILVVEDQRDLAELLGLFLERAGFGVTCVPTGEEAVRHVEEHRTDLMILDVNLPGMDGFAVCRKVRRTANLPILIVSARTDKEDKLSGFVQGADDYIEKPVDPDILIAKVKAILQRIQDEQGQGADERLIIDAGDISIDTEAHRAYQNGELLNLNVKEYDLLLLLVQNMGKTLHKDYLFNQIWGADSFSENQTLTVHIKRLRDKIERDPRKPKHIRTIWGVGYCYEKI